jgi:glycine/D-amino acid oxidase-like deaminating enzyme
LNVKEYPYWWDGVSLKAGDETTVPRHADVVIVGAGYTGLSAARELARRGSDILVLERERIGWGASSRNGGQVLAGFKPDPSTLVARFREPRARQLFEASLEAIAALEHLIADEAMDCEFERCGHVQAAAKPSHFTAFRREQRLLASTFHHHVELVSATNQRTEIGTDKYFGLLVDERSCALNPARYVDQLGAAACRAGARICEGVAVVTVNRQAAKWSVLTDRGAIEANEVLFATNGYTDSAAPWLQRRLVPIGSFIIATEPLSEADASQLIPKRRVAFDSRHFLHYFRLSRDRRLLFGGRAEFTRPTADTTRRAAGILRQDMVAVFPSLASVGIDYAWSGNVAFTRDQLPHAGRLNGAFYAGGYSGHGIAMATYLGALIARRIAGERIEHPLFDDQFAPIPLYTGTPWFLPLVGAYYRLKDWLS